MGLISHRLRARLMIREPPLGHTIGVLCCLCCKPAGPMGGPSLLIGLGLVIFDVHLPPSQVLGKGDPFSHLPGLSCIHSSACEKLPRHGGSAPRTWHNLVLLSCPSVSALMKEALSGLLPRPAVSPPPPPLQPPVAGDNLEREGARKLLLSSRACSRSAARCIMSVSRLLHLLCTSGSFACAVGRG